jgi:hypothetical protein
MNIQDILNKNKRLKDLHAGKRCFIIGNGPSIKTQNLSLLQDETTIVVSSFFRHPDARVIHPKYWVLADPNFWEKPEEYFWPTFNPAVEKAVDVKLFVPTGGAQFLLKINAGPLIDFHFFHYDGSKNIQSVIDFAAGVPPFGQNVIIVCLMLAYYLGCNPIYFLGCDHDFVPFTRNDFENKVVQHFYSNPGQKKCSEVLTWDQWQAAMARMNYEYDQLKQYADLHGFDVYNATRGGNFDNFPRVDFESLFAPSLDLLKIGVAPNEQKMRDAHHLGTAAIRLMNEGDAESADALLNEALKFNINTAHHIKGLYYLKALCLAKLEHHEKALLFAHVDHTSNPSNRGKSEPLIRELEGICSCRTRKTFPL